MSKIHQRCCNFGKPGIFRCLSLERLPHGVRRIHQRCNVQKLFGNKNRTWNNKSSEPCFGIGKRTKTKFRTGAKVRHAFAHQRKLSVESFCILTCLKLKRCAPARCACAVTADDVFQPVEFQKLFRRSHFLFLDCGEVPSVSTIATPIASIAAVASCPCAVVLFPKIVKTRCSPCAAVAYPDIARTCSSEPVFANIRPDAAVSFILFSSVPSTPAIGNVEM